VRLLEVLATKHVPTWLLISAHGWRLLAEECGIKDEAGLKQATGGDWGCVRLFNDSDRGAEPASGSVKPVSRSTSLVTDMERTACSLSRKP